VVRAGGAELALLLAAAEAIGDDGGAGMGADGGEQDALGERDRQRVFLALKPNAPAMPQQPLSSTSTS